MSENSLTDRAKTSFEFKDIRFLLVDDVSVNLMMLQFFLEGEGGTVSFAENGLKAIEMVKKHSFDIILMDLRMPEMNGYEATREIRKLEKGRHIPIIGLSANVLSTERIDCLNAGMNDFVSKPIEFKKVVAAINGALGLKNSSNNNNIGVESITTNFNSDTHKNQTIPIDFEAYVVRMGGNKEIAKTIIKGFIQNLPVLISRIEDAISIGDKVSIDREAHSIKGGASNIFAEPLMLAAKELELKAEEADIEQANLMLDKIRLEFEIMKEFAEKIIK